jgi:hypothetical protein
MLACLACLPALGCVEGEQTFTLNPNGSGKVRIEAAMVAPYPAFPVPFGDPAPGKEKKKPGGVSVEETRRESLKMLLTSNTVDAWKDVRAEFTPDGRLKFAGTAYFKKVDEFASGGPFLGMSLLSLTAEPGGPLTLKMSKDVKDKEGAGGPDFPSSLVADRTPEQVAKMSDAELDEYILQGRISYQQMKPMLRVVVGDLKLRSVYVLPGKVEKVVGFKQENPTTVSFVIDGGQLLASAEKVNTMDLKELRGIVRAGPAPQAALFKDVPLMNLQELSATVPKPGPPQFDYDAEVKTARAAYPELRKNLRLPDEFRFAGEPGADEPKK